MIHQELTEQIIGCAIEVHRRLGPGLLESVYRTALCVELSAAKIGWKREPLYPIEYRGVQIGDYRPDLIVDDKVVVEIKSVSRHEPVFEAQVLTYLRVTGLRVGLLINFNRPVLKDGIKRFVM